MEVWSTHEAGGARQAEGKKTRQRDRERCTVRQTEIHGYSNFGVLSLSYWKTVHSELSTEIRYWSLYLHPTLPSHSPALPLQPWDCTFSLLVIPSLSFSPPLSLYPSWDSSELRFLSFTCPCFHHIWALSLYYKHTGRCLQSAHLALNCVSQILASVPNLRASKGKKKQYMCVWVWVFVSKIQVWTNSPYITQVVVRKKRKHYIISKCGFRAYWD